MPRRRLCRLRPRGRNGPLGWTGRFDPRLVGDRIGEGRRGCDARRSRSTFERRRSLRSSRWEGRWWARLRLHPRRSRCSGYPPRPSCLDELRLGRGDGRIFCSGNRRPWKPHEGRPSLRRGLLKKRRRRGQSRRKLVGLPNRARKRRRHGAGSRGAAVGKRWGARRRLFARVGIGGLAGQTRRAGNGAVVDRERARHGLRLGRSAGFGARCRNDDGAASRGRSQLRSRARIDLRHPRGLEADQGLERSAVLGGSGWWNAGAPSPSSSRNRRSGELCHRESGLPLLHSVAPDEGGRQQRA